MGTIQKAEHVASLPVEVVQSQRANPLVNFTDKDRRAELWSVAKMLSEASIIPAAFHNKPADCFIALHLADMLGADPLVIMQNLYVIRGRPGWNASFAIAQANRSGVFDGRITYDESGAGDSLSVVAIATLAATGETVRSIAVDMAMATAEGWTSNKKYQSMPLLMLRYRAAMFLIRQVCPEVLLSVPLADEIEHEEPQPAPREAGVKALGEAIEHAGPNAD